MSPWKHKKESLAGMEERLLGLADEKKLRALATIMVGSKSKERSCLNKL